jgi:hypothetical protein
VSAAVATVAIRAATRLVQRVERLPLRVDADVRVVLQHTPREVAADRFEHVVGDAPMRQRSRTSVSTTCGTR